MVNIYKGRYIVTLKKSEFCYAVTFKGRNFVTMQQNFVT